MINMAQDEERGENRSADCWDGSMAYILRTIFFIGAIYALSPVRTDTSDMMTLADRARSAKDAFARTSSELAGLKGESAAVALQAARSWAALDETSRAELRRLIGEAVSSTGAVPTRLAGERARP